MIWNTAGLMLMLALVGCTTDRRENTQANAIRIAPPAKTVNWPIDGMIVQPIQTDGRDVEMPSACVAVGPTPQNEFNAKRAFSKIKEIALGSNLSVRYKVMPSGRATVIAVEGSEEAAVRDAVIVEFGYMLWTPPMDDNCEPTNSREMEMTISVTSDR